MNNYLLQLLKEVKTLIIPGLGALTVTNESTGEILFMPYLKFDDGTLAKHIASKENMELNDASNLISKFVREVTAELDKGNSYDMYQFGRFVKVDGEIAFEAWNGNTASETPKAAVETPVIQETEKPVVEEVPKTEEPVIPAVEIPKVTEETPVEKTEPKEELKAEIPPVPEEPKIAPVAEVPKTEEPKKEEAPAPKQEKIVPPVAETKASAKKPEPVKKKEPVKKEKVAKVPKEGKKRSVLSYILWGFLVLILGSGIFVAVNFNSLKKDFPILADLAGENDNIAKGSDDVKELEDEPDVNIDSETASEPIPEDQVQVVEDQLPEETPAEEPKKTTPKKETTPKPPVKTSVTVNKKPVKSSSTPASFDGSKQFHIIAGSFGSEANANKLAGKLRNQGFSEASVTMNNGMYRVSVKGFSTLNEATAEAASIQSSVPGAWVLKM